MKELILDKKAYSKLSRNDYELYERDFTNYSKSFIPGEWIKVSTGRDVYNAFVNPNVENGPVCYVVQIFEDKLPEDIIKENLEEAIRKRNLFEGYENNSRIVFGSKDSLPGLVIDSYENAVIIQINTAGIDRYRSLVKEIISSAFNGKKIIFLDNLEYRTRENLPVYESSETKLSKLNIHESGLSLEMPMENIQKVGYYYDHRENRLKLERVIKNFKGSRKTGVDLFCYAGTWGMHMLRGGVDKVDFVDQANMSSVVDNNAKLNNFENRVEFIRKDVFKFLDEMKGASKKYDIIVSDPPAFSKSLKNVKKAIGGYQKLHNRIMPLLEKDSLFVCASCTHGVGHDDLDSTVRTAAQSHGRKVQLLDLGLQGFDHPISNLSDKSFYIKYLLYLVS